MIKTSLEATGTPFIALDAPVPVRSLSNFECGYLKRTWTQDHWGFLLRLAFRPNPSWVRLLRVAGCFQPAICIWRRAEVRSAGWSNVRKFFLHCFQCKKNFHWKNCWCWWPLLNPLLFIPGKAKYRRRNGIGCTAAAQAMRSTTYNWGIVDSSASMRGNRSHTPVFTLTASKNYLILLT